MRILCLNPGSSEKGSKNIIRDFVYGCWCDGRRIGGMQMPPTALLYVASILKKGKHDVTFLDETIEPDRYAKMLENSFREFDTVVMMVSTNSFLADAKKLQEIKNLHPGITSIIFGSHPTFLPESSISESAIDFLVFKEPEFAILELLDAIDANRSPYDVKGIGLRHENGNLYRTEEREYFNMNDLPRIDTSLLATNLDYFNPVVKRVPFITMQTSRGCPAECNFCTVPFFYGKTLRVRSAKKVLEDIRYYASQGYKEIFFRDETFTAFKKRNIIICETMIKESIDITWIANGRVDLIEREEMRLMKEAGCHMLKFGVESGNNQILHNLNKGTTIQQCRHVFRMAHEVGIDTHAHVMIGCPGETEKTINNTINFVKEIDPTTASFGILTPYPGTGLFNQVAQSNKKIKDGTAASMDILHTRAFYNETFCDLSPEFLTSSVNEAYRKFYMRLPYLIRWIKRINSKDEFFRLLIAGTNIFQFALSGKK